MSNELIQKGDTVYKGIELCSFRKKVVKDFMRKVATVKEETYSGFHVYKIIISCKERLIIQKPVQVTRETPFLEPFIEPKMVKSYGCLLSHSRFTNVFIELEIMDLPSLELVSEGIYKLEKYGSPDRFFIKQCKTTEMVTITHFLDLATLETVDETQLLFEEDGSFKKGVIYYAFKTKREQNLTMETSSMVQNRAVRLYAANIEGFNATEHKNKLEFEVDKWIKKLYIGPSKDLEVEAKEFANLEIRKGGAYAPQIEGLYVTTLGVFIGKIKAEDFEPLDGGALIKSRYFKAWIDHKLVRGFKNVDHSNYIGMAVQCRPFLFKTCGLVVRDEFISLSMRTWDSEGKIFVIPYFSYDDKKKAEFQRQYALAIYTKGKEGEWEGVKLGGRCLSIILEKGGDVTPDIFTDLNGLKGPHSIDIKSGLNVLKISHEPYIKEECVTSIQLLFVLACKNLDATLKLYEGGIMDIIKSELEPENVSDDNLDIVRMRQGNDVESIFTLLDAKDVKFHYAGLFQAYLNGSVQRLLNRLNNFRVPVDGFGALIQTDPSVWLGGSVMKEGEYSEVFSSAMNSNHIAKGIGFKYPAQGIKEFSKVRPLSVKEILGRIKTTSTERAFKLLKELYTHLSGGVIIVPANKWFFKKHAGADIDGDTMFVFTDQRITDILYVDGYKPITVNIIGDDSKSVSTNRMVDLRESAAWKEKYNTLVADNDSIGALMAAYDGIKTILCCFKSDKEVLRETYAACFSILTDFKYEAYTSPLYRHEENGVTVVDVSEENAFKAYEIIRSCKYTPESWLSFLEDMVHILRWMGERTIDASKNAFVVEKVFPEAGKLVPAFRHYLLKLTLNFQKKKAEGDLGGLLFLYNGQSVKVGSDDFGFLLVDPFYETNVSLFAKLFSRVRDLVREHQILPEELCSVIKNRCYPLLRGIKPKESFKRRQYIDIAELALMQYRSIRGCHHQITKDIMNNKTIKSDEDKMAIIRSVKMTFSRFYKSIGYMLARKMKDITPVEVVYFMIYASATIPKCQGSWEKKHASFDSSKFSILIGSILPEYMVQFYVSLKGDMMLTSKVHNLGFSSGDILSFKRGMAYNGVYRCYADNLDLPDGDYELVVDGDNAHVMKTLSALYPVETTRYDRMVVISKLCYDIDEHEEDVLNRLLGQEVRLCASQSDDRIKDSVYVHKEGKDYKVFEFRTGLTGENTLHNYFEKKGIVENVLIFSNSGRWNIALLLKDVGVRREKIVYAGDFSPKKVKEVIFNSSPSAVTSFRVNVKGSNIVDVDCKDERNEEDEDSWNEEPIAESETEVSTVNSGTEAKIDAKDNDEWEEDILPIGSIDNLQDKRSKEKTKREDYAKLFENVFK